MGMTAVTEQRDLVLFADPGRYRVSITDLPVQTLLRLPDGGGNLRVQIADQAADLIHVARLEPGLFDVPGVLVRKNPVELLTVSQCVLHQMHVLANPKVDAFVPNNI